MPGLRFDEEDPQAIFQGFQLSEGLAAAPRENATRSGGTAPRNRAESFEPTR